MCASRHVAPTQSHGRAQRRGTLVERNHAGTIPNREQCPILPYTPTICLMFRRKIQLGVSHVKNSAAGLTPIAGVCRILTGTANAP